MESNQELWNRDDIVDWYDQLKVDLPGENLLLEQVFKQIGPDAKVLDIGIGGGRTTALLLKKWKNYIGVDYSESFVNLCENKFEGEEFHQCDGRDLSRFETGQFDFVLFSFNGIDYVNHSDRILVLKSINRVLKSDGLFSFSTHNRNYVHFRKHPWQEKIKWKISHFKSIVRSLYFYKNHKKQRSEEVVNSDYGWINDPGHDYGLMTYYITPEAQHEQLKQFGFEPTKLVDQDGSDTIDKEIEWMFYLARKTTDL
jgi:SAM-dependent methyltransferase